MKIKDGYMLRELDDMAIVVAVGNRRFDFNGMVSLNRTGIFLWKLLQNDITEQEILKKMLEKYAVEPDIAQSDLTAFINKARDAGLLDE